MYRAFHKKNWISAGLSEVSKKNIGISDADGLAVVAEDEDDENALTEQFGAIGFNVEVAFSERLEAWLLDMRMLRGVPLAYLFPDPDLLPPESIRFFWVDRTWVDRLIDGVISAANISTVDLPINAATCALLRKQLDQVMGVEYDTPITGMAIRSELVRRWPDMIIQGIVEGETTPLEPIRRETISGNMLIALFACVPDSVVVQEPDTGIRFGVEPFDPEKESADTLTVGNLEDQPYCIAPARARDGKELWNGDLSYRLPVKMDETYRVIDVEEFLSCLDTFYNSPGVPVGAREVAINLRQRPFKQTFEKDTEEKGYIPVEQPKRRMIDEDGKIEARNATERFRKQDLVLRGGDE